MGSAKVGESGNRLLIDELERRQEVAGPIDEDEIIVAALLRASCKFTHAFFDGQGAMAFTDSRGQSTPVQYFGIREEDAGDATRFSRPLPFRGLAHSSRPGRALLAASYCSCRRTRERLARSAGSLRGTENGEPSVISLA
jgi:hypothetical protein